VAPAQPVVEPPAPVRTTSVDELNRMGILKSIYFDFDRHEVRPDQRPTMEGNAAAIKGQLAKYKILIEGHCDERGSNEYNMALGDKRTNAARQYLVDLGVPIGRIRTISYGEERPADTGHNEEGWARNRRCEFIIEE
jgi:peptidoglycan-associated lipoprotein